MIFFASFYIDKKNINCRWCTRNHPLWGWGKYYSYL